MVNRSDILNYACRSYGTKSEHLWEKYPTHEQNTLADRFVRWYFER